MLWKILLTASISFIVFIYFLGFNEYTKFNTDIHRTLDQTSTDNDGDFSMKCERWSSKFGMKKRHHHVNTEFYSPTDQSILTKLSEDAKLELPNLIKYAYDNYDIKTMINTFNDNGYLISNPN